MKHSNQTIQTTQPYWVVINEQNELAVWPANRELPIGWQRTETHGSRAECLAYIQLGIVARPVHRPAYAHEAPQ